MDDAEFLQAFRDGRLPSGEFNHRGHLRLSWLLLRQHGFVEGSRIVPDGIRHLAASKGAAAKYHETITQFWLRIVYHAIQTQPSIHEFNEFLSNFPFLLDTGLPSKHWHPPTIQSMDARATWVEPDLKLLPAIGV